MYKLVSWLLYVILFFAFTSFNTAEVPASQRNWGHNWEEFEPHLFQRLQKIDDLITYADSAVGVENRKTAAYSEFLAAVVRKRFYHGYSYYSPKDNWVAWLAGTVVWDHLHAIVLPDDIMKHPMAACSQQAIVMKECFKRVGIDYREVDLDGHFVLEGKVNGRWMLFDTNLEPRFVNGRKSLRRLIQSGELHAAYRARLSPQSINSVFARPVYREVNAPIAPNATLFQSATEFISLVLPLLLPLGLLVYLLARTWRRTEEPEGVKFAREEVEEVEVLRN